jgi:type IV pilus assembly protein PilA
VLKLLDKRQRDDEGFTLIELMVVVLILGILMAIAIPTFLSTTNSAKDSAAESNATNAITNEMAYYDSNSQFTATGSTIDPSLPWASSATKNDVYVTVGCDSTAGDPSTFSSTCASGALPTAALIEAEASNGDCYSYFVDESSSTPYMGYNYNTSCPAAGSLPAASSTNPTTGHAAQNQGTTWYTQW